ncbi:MAG: peptide chain release factor N(5)-glutamine methyltransferase [Chloroflexota bacterium]|nr:MAG: peptide chain release factor N(5)-glutamine methyltransferase [Chloroflexota bacterium]
MATVEALLGGSIARLRAAGSEMPRLDAEVLLAYVLGIDRTGVIAHPESPVGDGAAERFEAAVARREAGEPLAYIREVKEFMALAFASDARALIPRPETERLVELAEDEIARRLLGAPRPAGAPKVRVIDVGTGCGTIAVALAVRLRGRGMLDEVELLATDDAPAALELARENAVGHAVGDRVVIREADLVPAGEPPFDLVLANLPYIATDAIDDLPVAASFEPRHALDGGPDGLAVVRRLVALLPEVLAPGGVALLEIGADQEAGITAVVAELGEGWTCSVELDLAGLPRVARVER